MSATTRTVLDSVRTLVIKIISVALAWESIDLIQMGGFLLLIIGMCLYNDVLIRPCWARITSSNDSNHSQDNTHIPTDQTPLRRDETDIGSMTNTGNSP